ncbi:TetR/AcrR family transcriptional regulator [Streptomyces sp. NPDC046909]|uniref:TetR/AcrR family transcriptional regulator n=1 Tax=Streptomyces sp. NPDC046909 TaxID=3155617 RepID=UPI0033E715EA
MSRRVSPPAESASIEPATDSKSARTRKRILDAAAKVLSRKGYSGMRLSDVAEVADLQAPAIYYHFGSREDLIEEVMWVGMASMRAHVIEVLDALPADASPIDRLLAAVEAHLRYELQASDYTTASIRNAGQVSEKIQKRQRVEQVKYGELWRELIDSTVTSGAMRADYDPFVAQMLVMGSLNWAAEWWSSRRCSIDELVRNAQSFVRHALID